MERKTKVNRVSERRGDVREEKTWQRIIKRPEMLSFLSFQTLQGLKFRKIEIAPESLLFFFKKKRKEDEIHFSAHFKQNGGSAKMHQNFKRNGITVHFSSV